MEQKQEKGDQEMHKAHAKWSKLHKYQGEVELYPNSMKQLNWQM